MNLAQFLLENAIWVEEKNPSTNQSGNKKNNSQGRSGLNDYMKYTGMGFQMLAVIGLFTWAGIKLDSRSGNDKSIYTAILSLLGVIIGIYTILKDFIHKSDD